MYLVVFAVVKLSVRCDLVLCWNSSTYHKSCM